MAKALKWSSLLVVTGLAIQLLCLVYIHPLSFITFLSVGCPLVGAGVVLYLFGLLSQGSSNK
jgi:hypothetical protein